MPQVGKKKETAVAVAAPAEVMEQLRNSYPVEASALRIQLPRLSFVSQDVTEEEGKGKNKTIKLITAAGTFFTERQTDEEEEVEGDDGEMVKRKIWEKKELGENAEVIILYQRRQLRMYDEKTELFTSSTVFDTDEEEIRLFCNKQEVGKGTPAALKADYMYTDKEGKEKSKLEENRILYVLMDGEKYQLNLRGSSMYAYLTFARKNVPSTVVTELGSEPKEKGGISWNQMTFTVVRDLNADEAVLALEEQSKLRAAIQLEKSSYAATQVKEKSEDAEMDEMVAAGKDKPAQIAAPRKKF